MIPSDDNPINHPALGLLIDNWPNWFEYMDQTATLKRRRHHEQFGTGATSTIWPVNVAFMENLQQVAYWQNQVEKYQGQALVPPRTLGRRVLRTEGAPDDITAVGPDYRAWVTDAGRHIPILPIPATADAVAR